jgi:hypothetical protein
LRSGKRSAALGDLFDVSARYVEQAGALVRDYHDLAETVKAGARTLNEAASSLSSSS